MFYSLKNAAAVDGYDLLDRAFQYGDGCFSTAQLYNNDVLLKPRHWQRLKQAAQQLMLQVDWAVLEESLEQLKIKYGPLNGTLKIVISRGQGQRGYRLPTQPADLYFHYFPKTAAQVIEQHTALAEFDSGVLTRQMGLCMPDLVGVKSLNRLEQVLLQHEADQMQWQEAIVSDVRGLIVEGISSNLFILLNKRWITPELGYNGVHGVMRAEILARMQRSGIACQQVKITVDQLEQAQSLFFCNALNPMKIASSIATRPLAIQPCVELRHLLQLDQISSYV